MGAQKPFAVQEAPRNAPMSPGRSDRINQTPQSKPAVALSCPTQDTQAPSVTSQELPRVAPVPPSAPTPVAAQVPNSRPAAAPSSPAMGAQTPLPPTPLRPVPQHLPVVPPVPPRPQATPVPPSAPVRVAVPALPSKPALAPPSPAMATRPPPPGEKSKAVTPPPPVANDNEKKPPLQNRVAVAAQPSRPGKALPTPPRNSKEKKLGQAAAVKPSAPVKTADSKADVPVPGNKKDVDKSTQPRARSSSAKRCVSDPILTPVTDEFPTEEWEGQWVAPEKIIVEERRKWPWKEDKAGRGGTKPVSVPQLTLFDFKFV
ncbi:hypothetical protein ANCCAN_20511 [Ancylostoma caninum]|uniref:Uncharacterized protein n=1 Tax=Ancylostoma caninum TaxID=29170 RepID=A0A368FS47_ANCCA|nr:hypothetical protein ANCCAN_20511 [Ancylostoma caninum]